MTRALGLSRPLESRPVLEAMPLSQPFHASASTNAALSIPLPAPPNHPSQDHNMAQPT